MPKVFISYRRSDSISATGRIYDRLTSRFSKQDVFMDVDNIPAGVRFTDYIQGSLRQCVLQLVVIGREWVTVSASDGRRRLDDPQDAVRLEVETALTLGITVLPVLVEGASMPAKANLPESLGELSEINAVEVRSGSDFSKDMDRLVGVIERVFAAQISSPPQPASMTVGTITHAGVGRWGVAPSPTDDTLHGITIVSASDCWAVGTRGTILHFSGGQWRYWTEEQKSNWPAIPSTKNLRSIAMVSANEGWAVGDDGEILHYMRNQWEEDHSYVVFDNDNVASVARVSTTDIWAVGKKTGHVLVNGWIIIHYDGNEWQRVFAPAYYKQFLGMVNKTIPGDGLTSVVMLSPREGWAVGGKGATLHYIGGKWQWVRSPVRTDLTSVAMISASEGWAVGEKGTILQYTGGQWRQGASPTTEYLTSVAMGSSADGWAVGFGGTILHYVQGKWIVASSPTTKDLYSVAMVSANEGWAVGNDGTILHYTTGV
jgi:photosystem II stability/assembly factor-like uncharacterized protein